MGYQAVWWRLFHAPNSSNWSNILTLVRLLFTLPVSNGKLERVFSTLKLIKVDKRSLLSNDSLDDLLVLNTDQVPMKDFEPDQSSGGMLKPDDQTSTLGRSTRNDQLVESQYQTRTRMTLRTRVYWMTGMSSLPLCTLDIMNLVPNLVACCLPLFPHILPLQFMQIFDHPN